jgi:hypothetical protein
MNLLRNFKCVPAALGVLFIAGAGMAYADATVTLSACAPVDGVNNVTGHCSTGPYGTVSLATSGANVNVTVTLDSGFYFTDSVGAGKALFFDLSGNISDASIVNITSGFTLDGASGPTGNIANSFDGAAGTHGFEYAIECGDVSCPGGAGGSTSDATTFSFTVDNVAISNFVANGDGFYFESSVYASDPGTGEVTGSSESNSSVPEPTSVVLFGSVALLAGGALRKRLARS